MSALLNLFDIPDKKRKLHVKKIPNIGGVIIIINLSIFFIYYHLINKEVFFLPKKEFNSIEISVNGKQLYIPHYAYTNLYNPLTCEYDSMMKSISLYSSLDKRFIYMYIFGGNAADTYMAKLIFDHEKYITRIIVEYVDLSCYGSFRKSFIGF
jgi:hypothetical protein